MITRFLPALLIPLLLAPKLAGDEITATIGQREIVFPDKYYGLRAFPDERISIIRTRPLTFLMVAGDRTVLMKSKTGLDKAVPLAEVLVPGPKGALDDGYAGIGGIYQGENEILAFYHAEQHVGVPNPRAFIHWSAALAVSKDDGRTFQKLGKILSYGAPRTTGRDIEGVGDVAVCPDHTGSYLYAYYTEVSKNNERGCVICMARSKISDGGRPGTWHKYYNGGFTEPGLGGEDSPVVPRPFPEATSLASPHVIYVESFRKYVMVLDLLVWPDINKNPPPKDGTYLSCSDDGITWSKPQPLFVGVVKLPIPDRDYSAHPGLYIHRTTDTTASGWLIYTYSPRWGGDSPNRMMHHMARRSIQLILKKASSVSQTPEHDSSNGWTALCDGHSLKGWKADRNPRAWSVVNGAIVGNAPEGYGQEGILYSESSFSDFEFTGDVKIQQGGHAGLFFRAAQNRPLPLGYKVLIVANDVKARGRTGSLFEKAAVWKRLTEDDTWFKLHVTALGNRIKVEIDGETVVDHTDEEYKSGYFAVQCRPGTEVSVRNPKVKRLP
jgi:hypothetical protein